MNLSIATSFNCIIFASILIATTTIVPVFPKPLNYDAEVHNDLKAKQSETKYNVPFLILLSQSDLTIAQLPLIDNGSISIVYDLTAENEKALELDGSKTLLRGEIPSSSSTSSRDADKYEQMPIESRGSLGNSEWRDSKFTSANNSGSGTASQEVGAARGSEDDTIGGAKARITTSEEEGEPESKRPKRSNSEREDGLAGNANSNQGINSVPESSSSTQNVTSARFLDEQYERAEEREASEAEETLDEHDQNGDAIGNTYSRAMPANNNCYDSSKCVNPTGTVEFSDFDVHMSLGYAFVADTRGRIHRFKLSCFETKKDGESNLNSAHEDDYTNSIDAGPIEGADYIPSTSLSLNEEKSHGKAAPDDADANGDSKTNSGNGNAFAEHANKANQSQVTHEQSGRHPTISGPFDNDATASSIHDEFMASESSSVSAQNNQNQNHDTAKARIIWSRSKHSLQINSADDYGRVAKLQATQRAYPFLRDSAGINQKPSMKQMENGNDELKQSQSSATGDDLESAQSNQSHSNGAKGDRRIISRASQFRTEIAVDWMNNLLFVLDKYRLVVMDFDGNNELVLIDDFNANNRPFDIKVDPINDFLFWLQIGRFHNTIYKLDLNVLAAQSGVRNGPANLPISQHVANHNKSSEASNHVISHPSKNDNERVALTSHHYAHPVITNLPKHAKLFTVDLKHSRIYVPIASSPLDGVGPTSDANANKTQRDEAEVFAPSNDFQPITHMNSTNQPEIDEDCNSTSGFLSTNAQASQILAYNLDGTDVGPIRTVGEKSHLSSLDDMQDITIDSEKGYFYWLTNEGKDLFEEYKTGQDTSYYSAQHSLDGKKYNKLMHFGSNQPTNRKPRLNLRRLFHVLASSSTNNRWTRSNWMPGYKERRLASTYREVSRFSPIIILGIIGLLALSIYLTYTLVFQRVDTSRDGSISGSSVDGSHTECDAGTSNGFTCSSPISRWINKPSSSRGAGTSTIYNNGHNDSMSSDHNEIASTIYNASNAIDEHYGDVAVDQSTLNFNRSRLANIMEWPTNMHDVSNKLYVPVEVLQDETLSQIHRVSIDQLEVERRPPLGEGHFGLVLQGTIRCTSLEKDTLLNKSRNRSLNTTIDANYVMSQGRRMPIPSSVSSGHGSSSTSSEFVTTNGLPIDSSHNDYLTPRSQCDSSTSDYLNDKIMSMRPGSWETGDDCQMGRNETQGKTVDTKLMVAIKKLKDGVSLEEKRDFLQEAKLLAGFDHPNIVHLIGICLDRGSTLIVMELMLGGDLIRYMQENKPGLDVVDKLTDADLLKICLDIVNGCCYLEELKYVHRDLAARNCLVSSRKREERVVKLADFGLARDIYKDSYYKKLNDSAMPVKWMAPECLIEQRFTTMSDVWSFGVVMWEVMNYCQEKPYADVEPLFMREHLIGGGRLRKPDGCGEDVYRLMRECWQLEPSKRPTFQDCRTTLIEIKSLRKE